MSLNAVLFGVKCGQDIYTLDRESWVYCQHKSAQLSAGVVVSVLIVIILIIIFVSDSTAFKIGATVFAVIIGGMFVANALFLTDAFAASEWDVLEGQINGEIKNGKNRTDAIDAVRANRLERERLEMQAAINRSTRAYLPYNNNNMLPNRGFSMTF